MTAFDVLVLTLLAGGAILGFLNGFVYAAISLIAWVAGASSRCGCSTRR